jgi:CHAD domain-containing protein
MSYKLKPDQRIARQVPRIARKQMDGAIAALADRGRNAPDRVHEARTALKKLRGLLRLVEPGLGRRFREENASLREIAAALSRLRDAEVLVKTFDGLFDRFDEQLDPRLRRVRTRLKTRLRAIEAQVNVEARFAEVSAALEAARDRARRWRPRGGRRDGGWKAVAGGLSKTYQRGRRALRAAYAARGAHEPDAANEAFHDFRKAVKYHGYHMRLLADVWPAELEARLVALERLGDLLGEDHDLAVFAHTLATETRCFDNERDRQVLLGLVEARQEALRAEVRPLAARVFAEPPAVLCGRLHAYWRIWRAEEKATRAEEPGRRAA